MVESLLSNHYGAIFRLLIKMRSYGKHSMWINYFHTAPQASFLSERLIWRALDDTVHGRKTELDVKVVTLEGKRYLAGRKSH